MKIQLQAPKLICVNVSAQDESDSVCIFKSQKIDEFDSNTYAKLPHVVFHNGTITVKVRSRLLPDAPDFARGFIGVAFRINETNTAFECFYVRPTNGRINDSIRQHRACQYFSYPEYTFDYFRRNNITCYENKADIGLDEWMILKLVIAGEQGMFYVNDMDTPVLEVGKMKHGNGLFGGIGLFVDTGTEGYFKDLSVDCTDTIQ